MRLGHFLCPVVSILYQRLTLAIQSVLGTR